MNLNRLADERKDLDRQELMDALKHLNEVWQYLYQAEQRKIVRMLIHHVEVQENGLKIELNLNGFDSMIMYLAS